MKKVIPLGGKVVPALGQGTWQMAEHDNRRAADLNALRAEGA